MEGPLCSALSPTLKPFARRIFIRLAGVHAEGQGVRTQKSKVSGLAEESQKQQLPELWD